MSDDQLMTHTSTEMAPDTTATSTTTTTIKSTTTPPTIEKTTKRIIVLTNNNTNANFGNDNTNSSMAQGTSLVKIKIGGGGGVNVVTSNTGQADKPKSVGKITIQAVNRTLSSGAETSSDVIGSPDEQAKGDPSKTTYVIKKQQSDTAGEKLTIASVSKELKIAQQPLVSVATAKNKIIMVKMLPSYKVTEPRPDTMQPQEEMLLETSTIGRGVTPPVTESVPDSSSIAEPAVVNDEDTSVSSSKEPLTIKISGIAASNAPASANSPKISRDLKALKRSQDNSKILTEFITEINQDGKARKSRKTNGDDDSLSSRSRSLSRGPVHRERSESTDRGRMTPGVEEKVSPSRRTNMRSSNSEFSLKQKKFLTQIAQNDENTDNSDNESTITSVTIEAKEDNNGATGDGDVEMVTKAIHPPPKPGWDKFCWRCHQDGEMVACSKCIRSFHVKCLKANQMVADMAEWTCPECLDIEMGEAKEKGKYNKEKLSVDDLNRLLGFALKRFKQLKGCDTLHKLITKSQYGDYEDYIEKNVDLKFMEQRVVHTPYHSTDEFLSDCKWILHNTIVYPHLSRHILAAKSLVRQCKMEMTEIDTCPECYENANTKKNWFVEVCSRPHILLWAKLKGFPYWPAKAMSTNASLVDVRFFGKHDKAWLPVKDCYLYSAEDPNQPKRYKNNNIAECIKEVDVHLEKLEARFGKFNTSLFRVNYNPAWETKQWCELFPHGRKELHSNAEAPAKTDLKMKIYKTADNNLSISKVEAKATTNGVVRRRQSGDSPTKSPALPPNKIKILERHTSDGKNKTYQIMKEVGQHNKTAAPAVQTAAATTNKLEPVKLKRKFDSWSNSSKEPAEKKLRVDEEDKAKIEVDVDTKTPSPVKEPAKSPETPPVVLSATEKQTPVDSPPSKRVTRNQQSFTEVPAAKADRSTRRSKTISKDNAEEATPDAEAAAPENNSLLTRSRRKSLAKGQEPTQKSPAKTNGKETGVVASAEKTKESEKSSETIVASTSEAPIGVLQIKEEPLSDNDETMPSVTSANVTMNSNSFTTSTPTSTPVSKPSGAERIMVKDIAQLTTSAKKKSQSPFVAHRRYGQLKTEPASPGVALRKSSPSQRARKTFPHRSRFHAPAYTQTTARFGTLPTNAIKQPNNMVYIPMNTMNFAALSNDVPPLAAVSKVSQFKNTSNARVGGSTTTPVEQQLAATQQQQPQTVPQKSVPPLVAPLPVITSASTLAPPSTNPPLLQPLTEQHSQKQPQQPQHMLSGYMSEGLAAAISETISNVPPKLTCRPTGALRSDGDVVYPSEAGPVSRILIDNSHKMADFFRSVIEDTLADLSNNGQPEARIRLLEAEIEKLKHAHAQEVATLKHNSDLVISEMRKSLENERGRLVNEVRKQCELERIRAVEETKKKQWCTNCGKEAQFHCCWNTSYCDYPCQEQHWQRHMTSCNQLQQQQQQQIMQVQQQQQQQQLLNKSKETLLRPGTGYHGPAAVQLTSTPPMGVAPTRLNVHNAAPKPAPATNTPFYTIVQNRQNGKWEMVSTKPNSMTNGSGSAFIGITTSPIATTSPSLAVATPVVGNFPALIQLSANDLMTAGKKNTVNKPN